MKNVGGLAATTPPPRSSYSEVWFSEERLVGRCSTHDLPGGDHAEDGEAHQTSKAWSSDPESIGHIFYTDVLFQCFRSFCVSDELKLDY